MEEHIQSEQTIQSTAVGDAPPPVPLQPPAAISTALNESEHSDEGEDEEPAEVVNWSDEDEEDAPEPATPHTARDTQGLIKQQANTLPRATSSSTFESYSSEAPKKAGRGRPPLLWQPVLAETEVSSYELERERRLAENRAVLLSLGILKDNASNSSLSEAPVDEKPKRKKYRRRSAPAEIDPDDLKRSRRLMGTDPEQIRWGRFEELGNPDAVAAQAFSDSDSDDDDDDIFDHAGMIGMSKIRKRRLGAGVDLVGGLINDPIHVETPFTLGFTKLTVWSLGEIVTDETERENYWSQRHSRYRHQYPVGYKATKSHYGYDWTLTIEKGEDGPLFRIVAADSDLPEFTGPSPTSPWTEALMTIMGRQSKTRVSGPHQYGFTDPFMQAVLFGLPNHPHIADMTTLRLVSRQARRGLRFGGRDGAKRKRGRPKNGNGLSDELHENVIVIGQMQNVEWERVLEDEKNAEIVRREERKVALEKEARLGVSASASKQKNAVKNEVSQSPEPISKPQQQQQQVLEKHNTEMMEVEVWEEEEIPAEELGISSEPRIVNGREFRSRKPAKQFRKVLKKIMVPVKRGRSSLAAATQVLAAPAAAPAAATTPYKSSSAPKGKEPETIQKVLTKPPREILERALDPNDDVIFCICEYPASDFFNTVACDFCNIWLHTECVGYVDPEMVPKAKHHTIKGLMKDGRWKCPRCRKEVLLVKK
ncbi:hypothetical protein HDU77_001061 [Chytriomyces hyalinus]|nr:hypothetical protein HDU77_001061 [Chytriomyces hyalinus]